jgi:hypothetical protein
LKIEWKNLAVKGKIAMMCDFEIGTGTVTHNVGSEKDQKIRTGRGTGCVGLFIGEKRGLSVGVW